MAPAPPHIAGPSSFCSTTHPSALHSVPQRFMWVNGTGETKTVAVPALYVVGEAPPSLRLVLSPEATPCHGARSRAAEPACMTAPPSLATCSNSPYGVAVHNGVGGGCVSGDRVALGTRHQPKGSGDRTSFQSGRCAERVEGDQGRRGLGLEPCHEVKRQGGEQQTDGASRSPDAHSRLVRVDLSSRSAYTPVTGEPPRAANVVPAFSTHAFGERDRTAHSSGDNRVLESRRRHGDRECRESGASEIRESARNGVIRPESGGLSLGAREQPLVFRKHVMSPREHPSTALDGNKYYTWVGALHTAHDRRLSPGADPKPGSHVHKKVAPACGPEERGSASPPEPAGRGTESLGGHRARTHGTSGEQRLLEFRAGDVKGSGRRRVRVQSDSEVANKLKEQLVEAVPGRVAVWVRQGQRLRTPRDGRLGEDRLQGKSGPTTPILVYTYVLRYLPVEALQNVIVDNRSLVLASAVRQKPRFSHPRIISPGGAQTGGQIPSSQTLGASPLTGSYRGVSYRAHSPLFRRRDPHMKATEVFTEERHSVLSPIPTPHYTASSSLPRLREPQLPPCPVHSSAVSATSGEIVVRDTGLGETTRGSLDAARGLWSQPLWSCCFASTSTPRAAAADTRIRRQIPPSLLASARGSVASAPQQLQGILVTVSQRATEEFEPSVRVRGVLLPSGSRRERDTSSAHADERGSARSLLAKRGSEQALGTRIATSCETPHFSEVREGGPLLKSNEGNLSWREKQDSFSGKDDVTGGCPLTARRSVSESPRARSNVTVAEECKRFQSSDSFCPTHLFETSSVTRGNSDWLPPLLDSRLLRPEGTDSSAVPLPQRHVEYFYLDRNSAVPKHGDESPALVSARDSLKEGTSGSTGRGAVALLSQDVSNVEGSVTPGSSEDARASGFPGQAGAGAGMLRKRSSQGTVSEKGGDEKVRTGGLEKIDKEKMSLCRRRATCEIYSIEDEIASDRASLPSSRTSEDNPSAAASRGAGPVKSEREQTGDVSSPARAVCPPGASGRAESRAHKAENCATLPPNENDVEEWLLISGASLSMVLGSIPVDRDDTASRNSSRQIPSSRESAIPQDNDRGEQWVQSLDDGEREKGDTEEDTPVLEQPAADDAKEDSHAERVSASEAARTGVQEGSESPDEKTEKMEIPSEKVETVSAVEEHLLATEPPPSAPSSFLAETGPGTREAGQIDSVVRALQERERVADPTEDVSQTNKEMPCREVPGDSSSGMEAERQGQVPKLRKVQTGSKTSIHSKKKPAELQKLEEEEEESTSVTETPSVKALTKKWSRGMSGNGGQVRRRCSSHLASPRARGHERIGSIDVSDEGVAGVYARFGNVAERYLQNLKKSSSVLSTDETSALASPRAGGAPLPSPRVGRTTSSSEANNSEQEERSRQRYAKADDDSDAASRQGEQRHQTNGVTSDASRESIALH
ncbi:hypothetical protein CSUI_001607 [Cystoisospora suis]|uniref:Uncharacterized protein n=1 Tax=Cystoisospora suis TaxID=483139 RepID=A0A2C6LCB8_9APIC|nr:hypothetical protein CSUI_001607 [Cystoisospora suis]